ncbi:hypothetical protein BDP27DRAFT_1424633 [Rhodocollybia butyracea]|uniref:Uncharacterized protein n=1 Tax=Rhodocollybia butyracea TaxID=206335 RepID=A0A9P5PLT5_9AGAR|nr:hypothetical protein BDP27DRAFT_1424633 [Rhodocollybia butyracea]
MHSRKSGIWSIAEVVLCNGTLYFFTISAISSVATASGITSIFPGPMSDAWFNVMSITDQFFPILIPILIHHLVLNLRAFASHTVQHSGKAPSNTTAPPLSTLDFAENRFLGNIGAPLDYNQWDNIDELKIREEENIEWKMPDKTVDPLTTLVPVIYDLEKGGQSDLCPCTNQAETGSS